MKSLQNIRIVFMGTPEFAVASLDALMQSGCNIVGVITAPDKPAGRGMQLQQSAVKNMQQKKVNYSATGKIKSPLFIEALKALNADMQIVVAFRMLPQIVWNMPPMGTINVHASLLPQYRGAAPINWAIINGEKETGITTFKLQQEIDTGNILMQGKIAISEDEIAGELHDALKILGANVLVKTIQSIVDGNLKEQPQNVIDDSVFNLKHAPKISSETCKIDWNKLAEDIFNLIRGLSPFPTAFTFLNDKMLKIYFGKKEISQHHYTNGEILSDGKSYLKFACTNGFIHCTDIQLQGRKRMLVTDFLRGYKINK